MQAQAQGLTHAATAAAASAAASTASPLQVLDLSSMGTLTEQGSQSLAALLLSSPLLQASLTDVRMPHIRSIHSLTCLLERFTALRRLDLASNHMGDEGATHLCKALVRCTALESLCLEQNNLSADAVGVLVPVLAADTARVRELVMPSNNIGDKGVSCLLTLTTLESLDLRSNGITSAGCRDLASVLITNGGQLRQLWLGRKVGWSNRIGSAFRYLSVGLAASLSLELLDLSRLAISQQDCWLLAQVVQKMPQLRCLLFSGLIAPATAPSGLHPPPGNSRLSASQSTHLETPVHTSDVQLEDSTAVGVGKIGSLPWAMGRCLHLTHVDLRWNDFDCHSCTALAAGLSAAPRLRYLDLSFNRIQNNGCFAFGAKVLKGRFEAVMAMTHTHAHRHSRAHRMTQADRQRHTPRHTPRHTHPDTLTQVIVIVIKGPLMIVIVIKGHTLSHTKSREDTHSLTQMYV